MTPPARFTLWPSQCYQRTAHGPQSCPWQNRRRSTATPRQVAISCSAPRSRGGRHPELVQSATRGAQKRTESSGGSEAGSSTAAAAVEQPRPEDMDERYRRADYSDIFQFESRQAFARCIAGGEPAMRLAEAALHVTAEDDAIASHSTVRFPVDAWMERIERLVDQLCRKDMRRAVAATAPSAGVSIVRDDPVGAEAEAVLRVTERYLFEEVGFRMPDYGRSNLPTNSVVDHPGVWEDARLGYLHETLIRRLGHPAALGLLLGEVTMQLLARGVLPCAAAIDTRSYMLLPRAVPLPTLTREVLLLGSYDTTAGAGPAGRAETQASARADGRSLCSDSSSSSNGGLTGLNTCTSEVLVEMLRHLKRSYWPFPWDTAVDAVYPAAVGSHGGFRSAAKAAMGDDVSAALAAIGKVAAWRLERGIWTSPGAGDLRRALAACERLVLLAGEQYPEERRDLAVLLLHCGNVGAARLELRTYLKSVSGPGGASLAAFSSLPVAREAESRTTALWGPDDRPDPFDLVLCRRLLQALDGAGAEAGNDLSAPGLEEPEEALGVESTLKAMPPWEQPPSSGGNSTRRYLPLTW